MPHRSSNTSRLKNRIFKRWTWLACLRRQVFREINILKADIECAESVLFGRYTERWLDQVDNLVIELHGAECERILFEAVRGKTYTLSRHGETTVLEGFTV